MGAWAPMGPITNYREEERGCDDERDVYLFPQHLVEVLLNSRRRVSDRPSWILIFKTPAWKPTNIIVTVVDFFCSLNKKIQENGL